ncbi:hypothetical protein APHAL10511_006944 [Amanita phalloides]|nr:hypothetical protein APHAL10511_006944 [Amanita phalloides]
MGRRSRLRAEEQQSSGDGSDYVQEYRARKRTKTGSSSSANTKGKKAQSDGSDSLEQQTDGTQPQHSKTLHELQDVRDIRVALLTWFDGVHDAREMPWRKRYNPDLSAEERNERAYEVWVSEVMLQQTQVITVVPYYNRWMKKFPTLDKLAASDIEQVNALWKGLGYYTRATRLLMGAQKVVKKMGGRIPDNAKDLQTKRARYRPIQCGCYMFHCIWRAGSCYGNVHRLLSRLLAIRAPPKAKATLDLMWEAATRLVQMEEKLCSSEPEVKENAVLNMAHSQYPGDINQALIELGSTVCKVRDPRCDVCPLRNWCCAYIMANNGIDDKRIAGGVRDMEDLCTLCEPVLSEYAVTAYPIKGSRKKAREELDIVNVIEWRLSSAPEERWFLLVRRPENGLLAGLYEFPTTANVPKTISSAALLKLANEWISRNLGAEVQAFNPRRRQNNGPSSQGTCRVENIVTVGDVVHVFSHIKKTYRVQWVILEGGQGCPELETGLSTKNAECDSDANFTKWSMWCQLDEVGGANIGSGVMKVWNLVKKSWLKNRTQTQ